MAVVAAEANEESSDDATSPEDRAEDPADVVESVRLNTRACWRFLDDNEGGCLVDIVCPTRIMSYQYSPVFIQ